MKTQDRIVAIVRSGDLMTRGKLCVCAVRKSGKKAYNLQYRRKTKQFAKSIPSDQVAAFERSTGVYRTFMKYVQKFVDEQTRRGIREIEKEARHARREAGKAR